MNIPHFSDLKIPNEETILDNLKSRYQNKKIYTQCGIILLSINPFTGLNIYDRNAMKAYFKNYGQVEPHIYSLGEQVIQNVSISGNQTIIVSGESGSGKTINAEHLLRYIVWRCKGSENLEKLLIDSHYILESFGNARTLINENSSRFGKYLKLNFKGEHIVGGRISEYLLEKSRVTHQSANNGNFHIFYMICASEKISIKNDYIDATFSEIEYQKYIVLEDRFKEFGIDSFSKIKKILLGILHIGSIKFVEDSTGICVERNANYQYVCETLKINEYVLERALVRGSLIVKNEYLETLNSFEKAKAIRDTFARHLYSRVFRHVINLLNNRLDTDADKSISILDIYGFEVFEKNDFDQFCINWANERIQNEFVKRMFLDRQKFYKSEEIEWPNIEFPSNDLVLKMIEKKCGIADLIDEESFSPCGNIESLLIKLIKFNKDEPCLLPTQSGNTFKIDHFAYPVEYTIDQFLDKNTEGTQSISLSTIDIDLDDENTKMLHEEEYKKSSIMKYLRFSMSELFNEINETEIHYVRCIRPNREKVGWVFDFDYVDHQIKSCGVIETATYPYMMSIDKFKYRYRMLNSFNNNHEEGMRFGKNFIFLKQETLQKMEYTRNNILLEASILLKSFIRCQVTKNTLNNLKFLTNRTNSKIDILCPFKGIDKDTNFPQADNRMIDKILNNKMENSKTEISDIVIPIKDESTDFIGLDKLLLDENIKVYDKNQEANDDYSTLSSHDPVNSAFIQHEGDLTFVNSINDGLKKQLIEMRSEIAKYKKFYKMPCRNCKDVEKKYKIQTELLKKKDKIDFEVESLRNINDKLEIEISAHKDLIRDMTISANQVRQSPEESSNLSKKSIKINLSSPHKIFACLIDLYIEYAPIFTSAPIPKDEMLSFGHVSYKIVNHLASRAHCEDSVYLEIFLYELIQKISTFDQNIHKIAFILSNLIELKHLFHDAKSDKSLIEMNSVIKLLFEHLCELQKESMSNLLPDAVVYYQAVENFKCNDSYYKRIFNKTPSIFKLMNHIDYVCSTMVYFGISDSFIRESLRYILGNINTVCFNRILVEHNFLSFKWSTQINFNLNEVEKFCQEIGFTEGIYSLNQLREVIKLVNLIKNGQTLTVLEQECLTLNKSQLNTLVLKLENYEKKIDLPNYEGEVNLFLLEPSLITPNTSDKTNFIFCLPRYVPSKFITAILSSI